MNTFCKAALAAGTIALAGSTALAQSTTLRIQTHLSPESVPGQQAASGEPGRRSA